LSGIVVVSEHQQVILVASVLVRVLGVESYFDAAHVHGSRTASDLRRLGIDYT